MNNKRTHPAKRWVVINHSRQQRGNTPTVFHDTYQGAETEMRRLLMLQPGNTFRIYESIVEGSATTAVTFHLSPIL